MRSSRTKPSTAKRKVPPKTELSEHKVSEAALLESEARYRSLFENIDEGFCIIEQVEGGADGRLDFRYIAANPAFETQTGVGGVVGRTIRQAFPNGSEEWLEIYDAIVKTGEPRRFERELDVERRLLDLYAYRIEDETYRRVAVIFKDVTERRQAEAALVKSERLAAAGRLAATLAHEINNPLQTVTNLLDLLRQSPKIDEEDRAYASLAAEELLRVTNLTKQSLSFYRETTSPVAIDLAEILNGILDVYAKQIETKKITVTARHESGGVRIDSYPGALRQVLSTLLLNAMEAVEGGGAIAVRVRKSSYWRERPIGGVRISVADNGCGITPANRSRVFEPFFTTKEERGTGLGLWVAQGIMTRLGGSISVRSSVQPGKRGTCFSIFLPTQMPDRV